MLLENRVALITGSASGMGRAMALVFAREGCDIIATDLNIKGAREVAGQVQALGRRSLAVEADISDSAAVSAMVAQAIKKFGKIDILINNAGRVGGGDITASGADWDRTIDVNLKSHFLVTKAVVPHMKKKKYGKIVFISSMGAVHPSVSVLAYHAAKAGVIGLTLNLAFELAPHHIYVNCIAPGPIETPFWNSLLAGMSKKEKDAMYQELAQQEVPLGRVGQAEDIAGPALFFSSPLSDYVTGQLLCVAGGQPGLAQAATFMAANVKRRQR
jgi:NAD(P)-dependent dehydrogenase (short-subunit alcohol dehydrogenase family)